MEWALKHPGTASLLSPATRALGLGEIGAESLSRVTRILQLGEDGITKVFGAGVPARPDHAEWAMMRGMLAYTQVPWGSAEQKRHLLAKMKDGFGHSDKYPSGEPPGVHQSSTMENQQAKVDVMH